MIDIHCHILHGLDDGSSSLEESLEMARLAYEDGIRHIVATPHFTNNFRNLHATVRQKTAELQHALDLHGIEITLHPGNEVRLESARQFLEDAESGAFGYLEPAGRFLLLEQRWHEYDPETPEIIKWLKQRGTTAIIPHPERHLFFRERPELLQEALEAGAWTQVTADSLIGRNNEDARRFALRLLDEDAVHTLATDAHNVNRKPNLSEGFRIVREHCGEQRVLEIMDRMNSILKSV